MEWPSSMKLPLPSPLRKPPKSFFSTLPRENHGSTCRLGFADSDGDGFYRDPCRGLLCQGPASAPCHGGALQPAPGSSSSPGREIGDPKGLGGGLGGALGVDRHRLVRVGGEHANSGSDRKASRLSPEYLRKNRVLRTDGRARSAIDVRLRRNGTG